MNSTTSWTTHSVSTTYHNIQDETNTTIDEFWLVAEDVDGVVTSSSIMSDGSIAKDYASKLGQNFRDRAAKSTSQLNNN